MRKPITLEKISRRGMLGCGAAALLPMTVWGQGVPVTPSPADALTTVAAARDDNMHMTIDVRINGRGPYRFVVDTGADCSVISDVVARDLGLVRRQKVLVEGVVRTVPAETVQIDDMRFGAVHKENLALPVLPMEWLKADGFLGLDMIDRYRVTFDFRERQLRIEEGGSVWMLNSAGANSNLVFVDGRQGRLRALNCRIDGILVSVFIDTGAEVSVGNPVLFAALSERDPEKYLMSKVAEIEGVTGGSLNGQLVDFRNIKIRDLSFTNGSLIIADLQIFEHWGLANRPAVLIGMNFLRQFDRVAIDYRLKEFDFQLSQREMYFAQNKPRFG